ENADGESVSPTLRQRTQTAVALIGVLIACMTARALPDTSSRDSAMALEQQGNVAGAESAWRSVLKDHPADAEAFAHLGLLEARQEHYKEAIPLYRKALALNPSMP